MSGVGVVEKCGDGMCYVCYGCWLCGGVFVMFWFFGVEYCVYWIVGVGFCFFYVDVGCVWLCGDGEWWFFDWFVFY